MHPQPPNLEHRLREQSLAICSALRTAIEGALEAGGTRRGSALRPVQLTSSLGLDKSLASRVVRALTTDDPLSSLHSIPTPQGLGLVANAARTCGAPVNDVEQLREVASSYRDLLDEFSGGRTDLEAALVGWLPEQRARALRDARRSVFRGMTTLAGTRSAALYEAHFLCPSAADPLGGEDSGTHGPHVERVVHRLHQDLRRLREGAHLPAFNLALKDASGRPSRVTTLGGEIIGSGDGANGDWNAAGLLVEDVCSHPIPDLAAGPGGEAIEVSIPGSNLDVNQLSTMGCAWRTRSLASAGAGDDGRPSGPGATVCAEIPTEALVLDLFVHRDLALAGVPTVSLHTRPDWLGAKVPGPPPAHDPRRTQAPSFQDLSRAAGGWASADVRSCAALAETVCREADLDVGEFHGYRMRVAFPLPSETFAIWWQVAPRSGAEQAG